MVVCADLKVTSERDKEQKTQGYEINYMKRFLGNFVCSDLKFNGLKLLMFLSERTVFVAMH